MPDPISPKGPSLRVTDQPIEFGDDDVLLSTQPDQQARQVRQEADKKIRTESSRLRDGLSDEAMGRCLEEYDNVNFIRVSFQEFEKYGVDLNLIDQTFFTLEPEGDYYVYTGSELSHAEAKACISINEGVTIPYVFKGKKPNSDQEAKPLLTTAPSGSLKAKPKQEEKPVPPPKPKAASQPAKKESAPEGPSPKRTGVDWVVHYSLGYLGALAGTRQLHIAEMNFAGGIAKDWSLVGIEALLNVSVGLGGNNLDAEESEQKAKLVGGALFKGGAAFGFRILNLGGQQGHHFILGLQAAAGAVMPEISSNLGTGETYIPYYQVGGYARVDIKLPNVKKSRLFVQGQGSLISGLSGKAFGPGFGASVGWKF